MWFEYLSPKKASLYHNISWVAFPAENSLLSCILRICTFPQQSVSIKHAVFNI